MAKNEFEAILELTEKAELRTKEFNKLKASMKEYGSQEYKRVKGYAALQEKINTNLEKALKTRATMESKALAEVSERMKNNHLNMIKNIKERQKAEESGDKKKIEKYNRQFQRQMRFYENEKKNAQQVIDGITRYGKAIDELNDRAKGSIFDPQVGFFGSGAKLKDFDKNLDFMETRLVGVAETVGDAFSGNLDTVMGRIDKIGKGTGNFLKDIRTTAKMKYGDKAADGDKGAKSILAVTKGLGKFGAVLGGITVGLGALFAIFKIAQGLEEAIKGVNKELLEAYGASDLVGEGMTNVYENVNRIRKELSDPDFANQLGVTLEQARGLAMEFQNIGINFMSLSEDGKDIHNGIEQMKNATIEFQAAAKTLGVGFGELVDFGRDLTQEMGVSVAYGAGLERMSREFGRIRDLAKQSALSTKDFFGVIKDLSSGMGTMNVRIGEAANLFTRLGKVMGPEAAQAFVKNLAGAFKGEGIQDRFKRIILTGNMKGVFKRSAEQTKKDFFQIYSSDKIKGLFREINLDRSTDLSKMSDADLEKAMGVLRRKGGTEGEGAARQLMQSVRLARGGKGGLSAQALALGDLDMTGAFSAQMKQLYNVTGGKGFRDVTAIEMEKISQMTGKSIEELESMRQIDMAMRDDFRVLQEIQKTNTDSLGRKDPLKIQEALRKAGLKDLKVDEKGNVVDKDGRRIDNIQDYIASQGSALDEVKTGTYDQLTLLQEVADSTLTSADMINNHLGGLIQQLNDPLQFMADIMGHEDKSRGRRKQVADRIQGGIDDQTKKLEEERQKRRDEFGKERRRVAGIKDVKKRQAAEAKLEERRVKDREYFAKEQSKIDDEKAKVRVLLGAEGRKIQGDDLADLESQALARVQRKKARSKSGRERLTDEQAIVAQIFNAFEAGGIDTKNMQATKGNLLSLLSTKKEDISEEGDVKDIEELKNMFKIIKDSGLDVTADVGGTGHKIDRNLGAYALHGIAELMGNITGISSGKEDSRTTSSDFRIVDKEGRTLSGTTSEGHTEGATVLGIKAKSDINYSKGKAKTTLAEGSELAKKRDTKIIEQGLNAEKQLLALEGIKNPTDQQIKKRAELEAKVEAKNRVLQDARKKTMVDALLESDRQKLRNQVMADFGGNEENFDTTQGRQSYISQIESQLKKVNKDEDPERYAELLQLRRNFKTYYAQDAALSPGQAGPPFIGNAGTLVRGTDTDTAMLVDFTKAGGGGGARGNLVINVNGNNETAMLAQIESYMRSIGFIS